MIVMMCFAAAAAAAPSDPVCTTVSRLCSLALSLSLHYPLRPQLTWLAPDTHNHYHHHPRSGCCCCLHFCCRSLNYFVRPSYNYFSSSLCLCLCLLQSPKSVNWDLVAKEEERAWRVPGHYWSSGPIVPDTDRLTDKQLKLLLLLPLPESLSLSVFISLSDCRLQLLEHDLLSPVCSRFTTRVLNATERVSAWTTRTAKTFGPQCRNDYSHTTTSSSFSLTLCPLSLSSPPPRLTQGLSFLGNLNPMPPRFKVGQWRKKKRTNQSIWFTTTTSQLLISVDQ